MFSLMLALATIEGGVIAVFAKQTFAASVPDRTLNLLVGLLGAMGELANVLSFFWTLASHGKPKARFIMFLHAGMVACTAAIALVPSSGLVGLGLLLVCVLGARVFWSGMITLRPTIWRQNYARSQRTRVVGVLAAVQVVVVAGMGVALGYTLDRNPGAYRVFLPAACVLALGSVWAWSKMQVRDEDELLAQERSEQGSSVLAPWRGPLVVWEVLRRDKWYAQFMLWMFVLGFGNLTVTPTMVITLKEEFGFKYLDSILVTSTIPCIFTLLALPFWRRFLDRAHVVRFRAVHGWTFILAGLAYTLGALSHVVWWNFVGAALMGVGFGGGSIAWNLGHVDFAPPSQTSKYMATHVTLNGVRGLFAPLAVTGAYEYFKSKGLDAHLWVQVISLCISIVGAAGFVHLRWKMGSLADGHRRQTGPTGSPPPPKPKTRSTVSA